MNNAPAFNLLEAINNALKANQELLSLNADIKIYDDVHQYAKFPYITIGDIIERDNSTSSELAFEYDIRIHIWSRYHGRAEILKIAGAVHNILHDKNLLLNSDTHKLVNLIFKSQNTLRDPDGKTYHGILTYRAVIDVTDTQTNVENTNAITA